MSIALTSLRFLENEAFALLTRLDRVKPFALQMTSVLAAAVTPGAQTAIERQMSKGRSELRDMVQRFLEWLHSRLGKVTDLPEAQRRFSLVRLRFNSALSQLDIFADVLVQRSEHEYGTWLGGLDMVAIDALDLPGYYEAPPVICYLDRGAGAAIRRARTRLPGGGDNPVAIIRVPRERMVGSGIASSLVHEVGHQASALLGLVDSLRTVLRAIAGQKERQRDDDQPAWEAWGRWISEIIADFWAVSKLGVAATTGLIGVVSFPRAFVFRVSSDDPHPFPWIRVKLGCALGRELYPDRQWDRLAGLWESFYPLAGLDPSRRKFIAQLQRTLPAFVSILIQHRPPSLRGRSITEVLDVRNRAPHLLREWWIKWRAEPDLVKSAPPSLAFAVIGQARADELISPQEESDWLGRLLTFWALRGTLDMSELCASHARAQNYLTSTSNRKGNYENTARPWS